MSTRASKLRLMKKAAINFILRAFLVAGLLTFQVTFLFAQTMGPVGGGQGSGSGRQTNPVVAPLPKGSHLVLTLRITEGGAYEVLSATEMPGTAIISDEPKGDFVYEVTDDTQTLAVEALSHPFEAHSFGGPQDSYQGHHIEHLETTTIVVKVPKLNLRSALDRLSVRLYKLEPGEPVDKVNPKTLQKLRQEDRLQTLVYVPGEELGPQIMERGSKLIPR